MPTTEEGDTVIDPFLGSGTTAVVALKNDRRFIGIEKDEEYFEMACANIEQAEKLKDVK
jgi:DNA modification methylase